jgi:biotin carboxylase
VAADGKTGSPRVLLMGYRTGIARALRAAGVEYVVWSDRPLRRPRGGGAVHVGPYGRRDEESRRLAEELRPLGPFTHVLAGTEASVVAASHARRVLDARLSVHTTVRRCHDKLEMKRELSRHGIPMTEFADGNRPTDLDALRSRPDGRVVVKDRSSSGGRGVEVLGPDSGSDVRTRHRIVERFVDAPEASVESFVRGGRVVFENVTEYFRKGHVNIVPAPESPATRAVRELSRRVIDALGIDWGITHLESYLHRDGPLFGEIALRPPGGYLMELLRLAYGFDAWKAFVAVELDRPPRLRERPSATAAAIVLHPGAGRVRGVTGLDEVRAHPCVVRARLRIAPDDRIAVRAGLGSDVGHVLLRAPDRAALLDAIAEVDATLRIDVDPEADPS